MFNSWFATWHASYSQVQKKDGNSSISTPIGKTGKVIFTYFSGTEAERQTNIDHSSIFKLPQVGLSENINKKPPDITQAA